MERNPINFKEFNDENIISDINMILMNIPNVSLLEKIRWIYIKLGLLFSYDYRILNDESVISKPIDFSSGYVGRYQTCTQISFILASFLNSLDTDLKATVIKREAVTKGIDHYAVEVIMPSGEKYIFDLTLDLFRIQSGCQTKEFGYTTNSKGEYDIIPLCDCEDMDKRLGLIKSEGYTDEIIKNTIYKMKGKDFLGMTFEELVQSRLNIVSSLLLPFNGYNEGKQYFNMLLSVVLDKGMTYREFNLSYKNENESSFISSYLIELHGDRKWIFYNKNLGVLSTSLEQIALMLKVGWKTNSKTLTDFLSNKELLSEKQEQMSLKMN